MTQLNSRYVTVNGLDKHRSVLLDIVKSGYLHSRQRQVPRKHNGTGRRNMTGYECWRSGWLTHSGTCTVAVS